jgi:hypothetical protein
METLQQSQEQGLTTKEFHTLFDKMDGEAWEQYQVDYPHIPQDELQAIIARDFAGWHAENLNFDPTEKAAFILCAAAPDYAINQARKNKYGADEDNLQVVSHFNDLVRDFVTLHPETDLDQLSARLVESVSTSGIDNEFASDTELGGALDMTIAGIRSESGTEQLFTYTGIPFIRGNQQQDIHEHIDYIVPMPMNNLKLDVKSSTTGTGSDALPYKRIGKNHYKLLRLFGPADFKGNSFKMRDESLEQKGPVVKAIVEKLAKLG